MNPSQHHYDVLIAGAGPVGLFLACELGLAGCSVLVLEQANDLRSPLKRLPFGLRGLSASTVESLDRRGLLEDLQARIDAARIDAAAPWMTDRRRPAGHFAGIDFFLDQIDFAKWPHRRHNAATPIAAELESIESVLTARAQELGVEIRRGCSVSDLTVTSDGVRVETSRGSCRGGWLVGCDGGRSVIRKAAGFAFTGTEPEFTGYFLEVDLADPDLLEPGHHSTELGTYIYEPPRMIRMIEFDGGAAHRQPITREHIQAVLRRVSGTEAEVSKLGLATTWTDRAYLASEYRRGRVLLAGDAAHIHSPLGGQGLNLGIGDAMNLGWKLARVIHGDDPGLLDSYDRERRPVAKQILDWSRAQVVLMRPGRSSQALRSIIGELIATRDGATYFAERAWGVGLHYGREGDHPLVGRSAPDLVLKNGTRVNDQLRHGNTLLIDFGNSEELRTLAEAYDDQLVYLQGSGDLDLCALLIRPDGFVGWVGERPIDAPGAASNRRSLFCHGLPPLSS